MSKEFFNARAGTWDDNAAEKDTAKLKALAARLKIMSGAAVLDVGTGTGVFVPYLLDKIGSTGSLVCLDYAEEMLKQARAKKFPGNVSFLCAAIEECMLPDDTFNTVVCYSVFPHFQNHPRALKQIARVLKQDGMVYICHTSSRQTINKVHQGLPVISHHLFPENDAVRKMLKTAGFTDILIEDEAESYLASGRKQR